MTQRLNYYKLAPTLAKKFQEFSQTLAANEINKEMGSLIDIRASQLNGCAFCLDMHVKEAKINGERELRLHHIAVWRESALFSPRERAVLEWTEVVTNLPPHGVPDEIFNAVRKELSEQELSEITFRIVAINGWNRLAISFTNEPGSMDVAFGLDKAGLK